MQRKLRESTGHRAQIRRRENITAMLEKLGDDATVFVKNENKLNRMLPGNQILKSLALRAKVELDDSSVTNRPQSVNKQYSVSERTPEQKKEILVLPDGSVFKFSGEKIDTTPERSQGVAQTHSLAETADAVSENSIPTNTQSVNKHFSVSERTPEQKKEILAQARRYASGEIGKDEFFRHVKQRIYSLKNV